MAEVTTLGVLNGFTKDIYSKLVDLVPSTLDLYPELSFNDAEQQGGLYRQQVILSEEAGFTHAASGDGAVTSNAGVSLESDYASVSGYQVSLEGTIDYESAARASSSKKAYADIVGKKLANMVLSAKKRVETELWWGQAGLGKVGTAGAVSGGTTTVLTLTAAEFAPFIWAGKKNFKVVFFNGSTAVASANPFTISSVNIKARTVTVVQTVGGDAAVLKGVVDGAPDTVSIYWHSAAQDSTGLVHKSMLGIMPAANTTTGNLFGLAVTNDLWAPNQFDFGAAKATFEKCINMAEIVISRGLTEDVLVHVHPRTWNNIMADQAALKRFGGKETKLANGASAIEFQVQRVNMQILGSGYMKAGYSLLRPKSGIKRIGAQDVSFKRPGNSRGTGENIFWDNPTRLGYSYRCYTHQALFVEEPWKLVYGYGVVNA
jgi:hypothetical protein